MGALSVGIVLLAPTLYLTLRGALQFAADDFWHLVAMSHGHSYPGGPASADLFRFASGNPRDALSATQEGSLSWYANPTARIAFFRPLSVALHRLDFRLFGVDALGPRLHSMAWYVAFGVLYARCCGAWRLAGSVSLRCSCSSLQRFELPRVGEAADIAWSPDPLTLSL